MVFDYVGFADTSGTGWATDLYVGFSSELEIEMELEYQLGISSDTVVVLEPDWSYRQGKKQLRTEMSGGIMRSLVCPYSGHPALMLHLSTRGGMPVLNFCFS